MNLDLTDEQRLLRDSLAGFLRRHYRFEDRAIGLANGGWRPEIWYACASDLGLFQAMLPVATGGFGGGGVEAMVILEQFGTALVLEPYTEAIILGLALLQDGAELTEDIVKRSVEGTAVVIPALYEEGRRFNPVPIVAHAKQISSRWKVSANKIAVVGAAFATHFILAARTLADGGDRMDISLFLVDASSPLVSRKDYTLIDGRAASDISFTTADAIMLGTPDGAMARIEAALEAATAALCAEAVGVMQAMLEQTVDYARQREQFGQPIARFQVLQHRMVDMHNLLEQSRSLAMMAALALASPAPERRRAISAAKAFVSDAIATVAQAAVQIHGGIGTTQDCAISHYFKRATVISSQFGTASHHRRIMAGT